MKKIFYYDHALPPKNWLVMASLLWDKIWISPIVVKVLLTSPTSKEYRKSFLHELYKTGDVIDGEMPQRDSEKFIELLRDEDDAGYFKRGMGGFTESLLKRPLPAERLWSLKQKAEMFVRMKNSAGFNRAKKEIDQIIESWERHVSSEATEYNHAFFNYKFKDAIPELEFFFDNEKSFNSYCPNCNKVFLYSVQAMLPYNPEKVTVSQVNNFRASTGTQRFKFRKASQELLHDIMQSSNESDFKSSVKMFNNYLKDELDDLQKAYLNCKIKAGIKTVGIIAAPPFTTIISHIYGMPMPFYEAGSIFVAAGSLGMASFLSDIEKGKTDTHKSPWGYLMSLIKLKRG